jgi:hypothetical protein
MCPVSTGVWPNRTGKPVPDPAGSVRPVRIKNPSTDVMAYDSGGDNMADGRRGRGSSRVNKTASRPVPTNKKTGRFTGETDRFAVLTNL